MFGIGRAGDHNLSYEGFWSPEGDRLLVLFARDDGHMQTAADLYLFDADGGNHVRLTEDGAAKSNPAWAGGASVTYETVEGATVTINLP
ncbi:MAG: hypothetical protein M3371_14180 [Acidobacteriota bacterium]|nr:hypothetical protein [Acidobacteriota bacterium]